MITSGEKPWSEEDDIDFGQPAFALMKQCLEHVPENRPRLEDVGARLALM
jgi:hypothetical protein